LKVVYIGAKDALADAFLERMGKEGEDVYFLSPACGSNRERNTRKHRFYSVSLKGNQMEGVLRSIAPDCIVYAGTQILGEGSCEEAEEDIAFLAKTLRAAAEWSQAKFLLLSSILVYGKKANASLEEDEVFPWGEEGMRYVRKEQLLETYRKRYGMETAVLRTSQLYSERASEEGRDFLSRIFMQISNRERINSGSFSDDMLLPLHVSDFTDAIKRVIDSGKQGIYNASGSFAISRSRVYQLAAQTQGASEEISWEKPKADILADNGKIKRELEWTDFKELERQLLHREISFEKAKGRKKKRANAKIPTGLRRLIENLLVFAVFFSIFFVCHSHKLFSQIDWLMIYVILVSLFMGIRQSAFAVILASFGYLSGQNLSILEMTNFYSYAGSVLVIMEFVFLGLIVSYTADMLKEELRDVRREQKMTKEEYEELKKINEENVLIKNEYEERLLDSKSGLSRLYQIVSRLMVLEPDRIFMEIMQIVASLLHTDTVAVYRVKENSPYLRLLNALNEASTAEGKSWDISPYPDIRKAMEKGELYQGDIWNEKPAVVLPILYQDMCVVVILIKSLPYQSQTLYHTNLLKTLSLLLRESVARALEYEELARDRLYEKGTDILKPEAFEKNVLLAKEKAEANMADYCVLELSHEKPEAELCRMLSPKLRETDYFCTDDTGTLYLLLNNTKEQDLDGLKSRFLEDGVKMRISKAFDDAKEA